jgi:hypothetical protein
VRKNPIFSSSFQITNIKRKERKVNKVSFSEVTEELTALIVKVILEPALSCKTEVVVTHFDLEEKKARPTKIATIVTINRSKE